MAVDFDEEVAELDAWLPYRVPKPGTRKLRLFCFHWAGSSASHYCDWEAKVGEGVELCAVQLPGREARRCEDVPPTLQDAAYDFVAACRELFENGEVPYAFFGHSSGTWMAYEVCRELRRLGMRDPALLMVSNFPSPQTAEEDRPWDGPNAEMAELEFQQECRNWGLPEAIYAPEMWNPFAELLRCDFELFDSYVFEPLLRNAGDEADDDDAGVEGGGCLSCPIATFVSEDCPKVGPKHGAPALMESWAQLSRRRNMSVDVFPGDHFYVVDVKIKPVVRKIVNRRCKDLVDLLDTANELAEL